MAKAPAEDLDRPADLGAYICIDPRLGRLPPLCEIDLQVNL